MSEVNFLKSYPEHVARLRETQPDEVALKKAIGGEFETVGKLEKALLVSLGLQPGHLLVDVGCGSGRLAVQLASEPGLRYLGTDVVPELLREARRLCARPDWTFVLTNGATIPCGDSTADMACFFSVFTHLSHEDSYRYLAEAKRTVKPGGLIVFSFLEFRIPCHWGVFESSLRNSNPGAHLDQFIDREAISTWASHLGLDLVSIFDGDRPHIPLAEELRWENGLIMRDSGNLGQSVAVLAVPPHSSNPA